MTSLLEFPCSFPIKAFGPDTPDFKHLVASLVHEHVEPQHREGVRINASRRGRYLSVTVTINAQNQAQLDRIYRALTADERIIMAL